MEKAVDEFQILMAKGQVEPEPFPEQRLGSGGRTAAEHRIHGIAWGHPQQQKHQAGDQPEHEWRQGQAGGAVAQ